MKRNAWLASVMALVFLICVVSLAEADSVYSTPYSSQPQSNTYRSFSVAGGSASIKGLWEYCSGDLDYSPSAAGPFSKAAGYFGFVEMYGNWCSGPFSEPGDPSITSITATINYDASTAIMGLITKNGSYFVDNLSYTAIVNGITSLPYTVNQWILENGGNFGGGIGVNIPLGISINNIYWENNGSSWQAYSNDVFLGFGGYITASGNVSTVPIPGTILLLSSGLFCLGAYGRRKLIC